jgi:transposase
VTSNGRASSKSEKLAGGRATASQGQLMQHRTRDVLIRQRTRIINALRAHLAELGIVAAQGDAGVNELRAIVADEQDTRLPIDARASVIVLAAQLEALATLIGSIEKRIKMQYRSNETSQRVETIPGIGVLGATAIVATAADPKSRLADERRQANRFSGRDHRNQAIAVSVLLLPFTSCVATFDAGYSLGPWRGRRRATEPHGALAHRPTPLHRHLFATVGIGDG